MTAFFTILKVVFYKEWRDALRDKRSLRMAFLPPLYFVSVFVMGVLFILHMQKIASGGGSEPIELPVLGVAHVPPLIHWLQEQGVVIREVGDDAYTQVEQRQLDYALVIPQEAQRQFESGEAVTAWLVYDATDNNIQNRLGFIRQQIWSWNSRMGGLRLLSRGISPVIANPIALREMNIASDQKMGFMVMASLPMFLILSVFIASVGFTADMMAGERERRSLESLLITPASSGAIVAGKWLTSLLVTLAVLIFELVLLAIAIKALPFNELGIRVQVSVGDFIGIFVVLAALAVIAVSLQQWIAIFARSFKDAQTYMGLIIFIPMMPLMYTLFNPGAHGPWFNWVPILVHQGAVKELLLGGTIDTGLFIRILLMAVPLAAIFVYATARQLRKPSIVYI